ncbi:SDR family NAD(P)-dependent oxidoreductase [Streptomyces sp. NPDC001793]|uniref:SDR family NAD(P)-dependent oxidoreductase n=1 Tax=Streptomyces sp. NPDC001793 TaxID=3154657 RepID=UPI00331A58C1
MSGDTGVTPVCGGSLSGRTALVTGGAQGLGAAVVRVLYDAGARVLTWDVDEERNRATAVEIDPDGALVLPVGVDLADLDAVECAYRRGRDRFGPVDILVNNAARALPKSLWETTAAEWDQVFEVNVRAAFFLTRIAATDMRARGWGRVVNMASLAGQTARPTGAAYGASKAALAALTRVFAAELGPYGVTVNTVAPAMIDTPMARGIGQEALADLIAQVPVGRIATPEEVALLVRHLVGPDAGFITGATYDINGGALMR